MYKNKTKKKNIREPPKNICTVEFRNKGLEFIRLSSMINHPGNLSYLPVQLQSKENTPVVTYKRFFTKSSLKATVEYLISKCYFTVGNPVFMQKIGIPMGIDSAPFWANLFL